MQDKKAVYWKLFSSTFYLSSFTLGGGYVIIPLMKKKFVDELNWVEEEEMLNLTAIAQSSPGAVAVNASILLGYHIAGIPGAIVTIFGTILPPLIIISIISMFYQAFRSNPVVSAVLTGMQAGVAAVIADVIMTLGGNVAKQRDVLSIVMMILAFVASFVFKLNVMYIILACACVGALRILLKRKTDKKDVEEQ